MKYNSKNKPLVCMQTNSTCYKETSTMTPKGVLWHSTGANNPYIHRYVQPSDNASDKAYWLKLLGKNKYGNDWNHIDRKAGLNCWIGKLADGTVTTVQTMPWNYGPWGCGSGSKGSCNSGWIQFEICEADLNDKDYFNKVYKEACEITAYLCDMYKLDPHGTVTVKGVKVPVILCHQDAYKLGFGSNHGDVYTWFKRHGKTMDDVRNDVAALMGKSSSGSSSSSSSSKPTSSSASNSKFTPYKVKVATDGLNIRSDATIKSDVVGVLNKGDIVTITDKSDIWEKTSKGWISSNYTEKVKESTSTSSTSSSAAKPTSSVAVKADDVVKLSSKAVYYSGKEVPAWVKNKNWIVKSISGDRAVIDNSADGKSSICSPINVKYLTVIESASSAKGTDKAASYSKSLAGTYKTKANLNLRKGANTSKSVITTIPKGSKVTCYGYYTPDVNGTKWYYISFKDSKGTKYTGFASSSYLTK